LVRRYAGLAVAGDEEGTSIGLGYIPEFYIDFGVPGMFFALFAYGLLLGLLFQAMTVFSPSYGLFVSATSVMFLLQFGAMGEIAKQLGGFVQTFVIFGLLLLLLGRRIHHFTLRKAPAGSVSKPPTRAKKALQNG